MAIESKYIKLDANLLLKWTFDDQNLKQEPYKILHNFNTGVRSYISEKGNNNYDHTMFPIDNVLRKYAQVDTNKYNFLKLENYSDNIFHYENLKIYMPSNFSFYDNEYKGFYIRIYTYDYNNKNQYDLSNYYYDDTIADSRSQITLNQEFLYNNNIWGKYISLDIPSVEYVAKQRSTNTTTPDTLNSNLTKGVGLSDTSPIFIEFSFISTKSTVLGTTTYRLSSSYSTSINQSPEYQDVGVSVVESTQGDFFEISGLYNNNSEEFDNYIEGLISKGRGISLEYLVSLFEENILMNEYTYVITENFAQKLWYRPIISFSNTTAMINVELKINDSVDGSQTSRFSSLGMTKNLFKYGKKLSKIDISGAFVPKIYNLKNTISNTLSSADSQLQDINLTKVNFPVITDRIKILATSSSSNSSSDYKSMGLAEIILNPFDNYIKFLIASDVDNTGQATPYDLSKLLQNATLLLVFKTDNLVVEEQIYQETDQNDLNNGIVIFKIPSSDILTIKNIALNNKTWYIVVKSNVNDVRTLLYSGKFVTYDQVSFVEGSTTGNVTGFNPGDMTNNSFNIGSGTTSTTTNTNVASNSNAMVFLNLDADVTVFENYLSGIKANVYVKRAAGNETCGSYFYFLLNLSNAVKSDIRKQSGVKEVIDVPFDIGKNTNASNGVNVNDLKNRVTNFNCDVANKK